MGGEKEPVQIWGWREQGHVWPGQAGCCLEESPWGCLTQSLSLSEGPSLLSSSLYNCGLQVETQKYRCLRNPAQGLSRGSRSHLA